MSDEEEVDDAMISLDDDLDFDGDDTDNDDDLLADGFETPDAE